MSSIIHTGDCIEVLKGLPDASVQCVVTSPPYYGLRDYGNEGQIGLEQTPEEYVAKMVEVFREVRRVLRDDGTVWLNIGDSYAGSGKGRNADGTHAEGGKQASNKGTVVGSLTKTNAPACKPKDLIGIPWMLAFALRADGWYLRQDIIWHKPNPMPESVTDRCTKAHEYVFLLAKSERYYYDAEAVKEPYSTADPSSASYRKNGKSDRRKKHAIYCSACDGSGDETDENGDDCQVCGGTGRADIGMAKPAAKNEGFWKPEGTGRNRRSVWTITTKPFKGAHFAVMPEALVEPCVLAGSKAGDTILDPFTGSGTVAVVAERHGRSFVGAELNPDYVQIAYLRIVGARIATQMQADTEEGT